MIMRVNYSNQDGADPLHFGPAVFSVPREKVERIRRNQARVGKMIVFAVISGLIMATVVLLVALRDDPQTIFLILGIIVLVDIGALLGLRAIRKTREQTNQVLAADGSTVLVVDQYGIRVGDRQYPRDRITAVGFNEVLPSEAGRASADQWTINIFIGLNYISTLNTAGLKSQPYAGDSNAATVSFIFNIYLEREELPRFLQAATALSRGEFPVGRVTSARSIELGEVSPG